MSIDDRFSTTVEFGGNSIKLSNLKEPIVQRVRMVCYSIKRAISKLRNILARSVRPSRLKEAGTYLINLLKMPAISGEKGGERPLVF